MPSFIDSFKKRWNVFLGRSPNEKYEDRGRETFYRPDTSSVWRTAEKSLVNTIYNRIAVDVASVDIEHVKVDEEGRYLETIPSKFNDCLNFSANIDQTGRAFIQDVVMSMFDEGYVAIVITDATADPNTTQSFDILSLRVGRIIGWYPEHVKVEVYNEKKGVKIEKVFPKTITAIIENPFYDIMNRPNSTLKRLKSILNDLDALNNYAASGKLDMLIQLPYSLKTESQQKQAIMRRQDLENQVRNSEFGIGYISATEKVIPIGKPLENNLWTQAKELTDMLYSELGLSPTIFDGTATYDTMQYYNERTINPILTAITEAMNRTFISRTGRTQGQRVMFFKDPLKFIPMDQIANLSDRLSRNQIVTANEFRGALGFKPSQDPRANELRNPNLYPTEYDEEARAQMEGGGYEEMPPEEGVEEYPEGVPQQ